MFTLGAITFHAYGFHIGIGIFVALYLFQFILEKEDQKIPSEKLAITVLLCGVIGARMYHLVTDWHLYIDQPWWQIFAVWNGGIGIIGGLLGGVVGLFLGKKIFRVAIPTAVIFDSLAISLPFAQAIGRWGNYVNHELFGRVTNVPWGISIPQNVLPTGFASNQRFHPLFLYESILNVVLGALLFFLYQKKYKKIGSGFFIGSYCLGYGMIRFSLEFLRFETARWDAGWVGKFSIAQWWMIGMISIGIFLLCKSKKFSS